MKFWFFIVNALFSGVHENATNTSINMQVKAAGLFKYG